MKKFDRRNIVFPSLLAITLILIMSCSAARPILTTNRVHELDRGLAAGSFTLVLYTAQDSEYLETVAILDFEGDDYEIEPFGAQFNYATVRGQQAEQALAKASEFIKFYVLTATIELRAIHAPGGGIIGYELRPLHNPFVYGRDDLIDVSYFLKAPGKVIFYVELKDSLKQQMIGGDGERK